MIKSPLFRISQYDAFTENSVIEFNVAQIGFEHFDVEIDVTIPGLGNVESYVYEQPDYGTALDLALSDIFKKLNDLVAPEYDAAKEYRDRMESIRQDNPNWRNY